MFFPSSESTEQVLPLQIMMIHDLLPILEYPVIGILISVNKNPAYQDIHSIQTNTPVYETLRIITNERFTVLCFTLI